MIKPIPRYTQEDNSAYDYYTGENHKYKTTVVIDELNDSLVLMSWHMPEVSEASFCTCKDYSYRQRKCKHIQEVMNYLQSIGIEYREEEKQKREVENNG